jgi:hypothetical protein
MEIAALGADWSTVPLSLSYLAMSTVFTMMRLLPLDGTEKDVEILALRHQLAILQRQIDRPQLAPPTGCSWRRCCTTCLGSGCGRCR